MKNEEPNRLLVFLHGFLFFAHTISGEPPKSFIQEDLTMNNTPNESIKCTVNNCVHHCQDKNYCSLTAIQVGTHETNPTEVKCTDCESFKLK